MSGLQLICITGFGMSIANVQHFLVGNKLIMNRIYQSPRYYGRGLCLKAKDKAKDLRPENEDENKNLRSRTKTRTRIQLFVLETPRGREQVLEDTSLLGDLTTLPRCRNRLRRQISRPILISLYLTPPVLWGKMLPEDSEDRMDTKGH